MKIISFIYKLLFNRTNKQFDSDDPELFHTDKYLRPDHKNYKQCPHCKIEAKTNKEIIDLFGVKNLKRGPSFQSWCRECRNKHSDEISKNDLPMQNKIDL